MLTEEQQKQIREEKIFRKKVRESLEKEKEGKTWKFLNSSFGIWLLSSVVLGLITFFYNEIETTSVEDRQKAAKIEALDSEIGARVTYFKSQASNATTCGEYVDVVHDIIVYTNYPHPIYSASQDFKDLNFHALLIQLSSLVKDDGDRKAEMKAAIAGFSQIQHNARRFGEDCLTRGSWSDSMTMQQKPSLKIIQDILNTDFNNDHWQ